MLASGFYESLLLDHVTLVPQAVELVTETGVVDAEGIAHEVDVLVMATGFEAADHLNTIEVIGRGVVRSEKCGMENPKCSWACLFLAFRISLSSMGLTPTKATSLA